MENIIKNYEVKRMKYFLGLKSHFDRQTKARAVELVRLTMDDKEIFEAQQDAQHAKYHDLAI